MKSLKLLSVFGYVLMVLGLIPLAYFKGLISASPIVIGIQLAAVLLMVWARVTFGSRSFHYAGNPTEGGLVTTGPYHYIRHPIYAAVLYFSAAGALANWSTTNLVLLGVIACGAGLRIFCEERLVIAEYPEYAEYSSRTKRILPFVL
jgi:protein-S-isoprenylcysteine O-methyltransferase Ste14